ncbi:MAG: substrate-binding domain-containing protein [Pseudolabrys sp.]|nr:substrate-binding domain-containing protein [Pseudolabrys sp.]
MKVLCVGAFRQVLDALTPDYEKSSGNKVVAVNDTAGALKKRIEGGEGFDLVIITPTMLDEFAKDGKVSPGSGTNVATVGIGVGVKEGAPKPDISTVDALKRALVAAKAVAYVDPKSGGSSGIYVDKLLDRLGIADQVKPKAKLRTGGHAGDYVASGEADIVLQQASEILPVKGVVLLGPLPAEIQNITTYSAGIAANTAQGEAAHALLKSITGARAADILKAKGMQPPD